MAQPTGGQADQHLAAPGLGEIHVVDHQGLADCFEATRPFSTGGVYINFLTEEEGGDRIEAAYGRPVLQRLGELKRRFDPGNLFRHTKGVLG